MNQKQLFDNFREEETLKIELKETATSPVRPSAMKLLDQMESKDNLNYDSDE